jgi:hypothetical protein
MSFSLSKETSVITLRPESATPSPLAWPRKWI